MDATVHLLPVQGVDEDMSDTTSAVWTERARAGGMARMKPHHCALLAGMYAAREGQGQHQNPFLRGGGDLSQAWLNGYLTTPKPLQTSIHIETTDGEARS